MPHKNDFRAAIVVFLVALPLCLGIALASNAPLIAGLISGIVGGIVVGSLSGSSISVSGPAAGLTVIVVGALNQLPSYHVFSLAILISGFVQIGFGLFRLGFVSHFIPSAVIKGMLAAIGLILILKQIPHAVGWDQDFQGDMAFFQTDGENTFSELWQAFGHMQLGAVIISGFSLVILLGVPRLEKYHRVFGFVPAPLLAVSFGILCHQLFLSSFPQLVLSGNNMVQIPIIDWGNPQDLLRMPDWSYWSSYGVWTTALTLALVGSLESLLNLEAIEKIDPMRRLQPSNRELIAQGSGNIVSGLMGGLPITSVIVRSSANLAAGSKTKGSAIMHGILLLLTCLLTPELLNQIPLSCLAAILIVVGYKLTRPELFVDFYRKGANQIIPFVFTIVAIVFTDLLIGIALGLVVGVGFVVRSNYKRSLQVVRDGNNYLVRLKKDVNFLNKSFLKKNLGTIPSNSKVMIDLSRANAVDHDIQELIEEFRDSAKEKNIEVTIKESPKSGIEAAGRTHG